MNLFKKNKYSILQKVLKSGFILVIFFSFLTSISLAVETDFSGENTSDFSGADTSDFSGSNTPQITIDNPIRCDDIPCFINEILNIVLVVGIPLVTLAIIYSGFLFVFAQGAPDKLKTARQALLYTLIGAALLLGAFILSEAIAKTVEDINKTS